MTAVFAAHGHLGSAASFDAGLRPALAVAAGLSLLGATAALFVAPRRKAAAAVAPDVAPEVAPATAG